MLISYSSVEDMIYKLIYQANTGYSNDRVEKSPKDCPDKELQINYEFYHWSNA